LRGRPLLDRSFRYHISSRVRRVDEVVSVNRPVLVALVNRAAALRRSGRAPSAAQFPNGEPGAVEVVVAALESCLPRTSIRLEQQRVHVDPSSSRCDQLNPVGPPIGIHDVAQLLQHGERCTFVCRVEVDVEVSMRAGLLADKGVDAPASLQPILAANSVQRFEHG
jgi:hypothetical protein